MTFNITAEVSLRGTYAGALSQKAAKALCEGWLDPDESWADQAEDTITTALENELEEILRERLYAALPQGLVAEIARPAKCGVFYCPAGIGRTCLNIGG